MQGATGTRHTTGLLFAITFAGVWTWLIGFTAASTRTNNMRGEPQAAVARMPTQQKLRDQSQQA